MHRSYALALIRSVGTLPTIEKNSYPTALWAALWIRVFKTPQSRTGCRFADRALFLSSGVRFVFASFQLCYGDTTTSWLNFDDNKRPPQTVRRIIKTESILMATAKKKVAPKAPATQKTTAPAKAVKPAAKAAKPAAKAAVKKAPVVSKTAKALAKISAGIAKLMERKDKISAEIAALRDQRAALKTAAAPVAATAVAAPKAAAKAPAKKAKAPAKK